MKKSVHLFIGLLLAIAFVGFACGKEGPRTAYKKTPQHLETINFDFDSSIVTDKAQEVLQNNAAWMKKNSETQVTIEGHCDERGTAEYNIALGHRRAQSAKSYLSSLGVSGQRFKVVSYGEEKPSATCHDESCWWKNRRAEFVKN